MLTKRFMRNLTAFAFGVVIAFVMMSGSVRAETVSATYGYATKAPLWYSGSTGANYFDTCDALAKFWRSDRWCGVSGGTNGLQELKIMQGTSTYSGINAVLGWCGTGFTLDKTLGACKATTQSYSCPTGQNWTLSGTSCTRPDCVSPQVRQSDGTCAAPPCVPDTVVSSGFYDMGVSPKGFDDKISVCANGCQATFYGYAPYGTSLVGGVTHYWAQGEYRVAPGASGNGTTCTSGTAPTQSAAIAPDTCGATQGKAMMNGKTVCINTTTGQPADTNGVPPDTTAKPGNSTTTNKTADPTTGSTTTTTTTTAPDGSTSVVTTTCDASGDNCSTSTTNTPGSGGGTGAWTGGGSGSGGAGGGTGDSDDPTGTTDDSTNDFCAENPDNEMCAKIKAGTGAGTSDLYTKGTRTTTDVFNDFGNKVKTAGFYSAATNYFSASVPAGSCSGLSQSFDFGGGQSVTIDLDSIFCGSTAAAIFSILGYGLMLAASWTAFRIAIL